VKLLPAFIDYPRREVNIKILYCGPDHAGKSTSLTHIYEHASPQRRGRLISLATKPHTVLFDFVPDLGKINGFGVRLHLVEVPAASYYTNTRELVCKGAAGVVFVADSSASRIDDNLESLNNVRGYLTLEDSEAHDVPVIFQYNKRDLQDILSVESLRSRLNTLGAPETETVATQGLGVSDCLMTIAKLVILRALPH
jgi:mutual gliding-motility protein MglA